MTTQIKGEFKTKESLNFLFGHDGEFDITKEEYNRLNRISNQLYIYFQKLQILLDDRENTDPREENRCERQIKILIKEIEETKEGGKEYLKLKAKEAVLKLVNDKAFVKIKLLKNNSADKNTINEEKIKFTNLKRIVNHYFGLSYTNSFKNNPSAQSPLDVNLISSSANQSEKKSIIKSADKSPVKSSRAKAKHAVYFGPVEVKTSGVHRKITLNNTQADMSELSTVPVDRMKMEPFKLKRPMRRGVPKAPSSHTNTILTRQFYPEDGEREIPVVARK